MHEWVVVGSPKCLCLLTSLKPPPTPPYVCKDVAVIIQSQRIKKLTSSCIMSQKGQPQFKNLATFAARILKCLTILGRYALKS